LKQLRWSDVNWEQNRFLVRSPKTERHAGHRERLVPLFPGLRKELDRHFLLDETVGSEFVIKSFQGTTWKIGEPFQKIACNAGLGTINRPFDNLRMSRSNEVLRQFGEIKESLWIGHSSAIMRKHYFRLSDADFSEAAEVNDEKSHAESHAVLQ
jgi:integrase